MSEKLSVKVKAGYGICDLGGNLFFTAIGFWLLNYLTDTVGIAAGIAGTVIAIGKIWDAVTDPMVGYLSDRTSTRWGRRRPYILWGSIPLFITMIFMFTNPNLGSQKLLFIWGVLAFCLLNTAYTIVNIPYNSLTPELTQDYHERTSLNGYRFGFAIIGTLLGAGAALPIVNAFPSRNTGFTAMGTIFGAIMLVTALVTFFTIREPDVKREKPDSGFLKTYIHVFRNKPYVLILLTYTINIIVNTIVMGVAVYYFKYIHGDEKLTTIAMVILLLTAMVFIPLSVLAAKRVGKKLVYGSGMVLFSAGIMILFFFAHIQPVSFSYAVMVLVGMGLGITMALPYAMVPDAVEYDYLCTGKRTEGAFYGIWTFGIKIGQALALGLTGLVLSLTGYVPDAAQSASAIFGIRLLIGPLPAVIYIFGLITLYLYPINEKRYNEILEEIHTMEGKG